MPKTPCYLDGKLKLKSFYFAKNSRVVFIHKEKQRGCPLLGANKYTHIYIYIIYLFET